MEWDWAFVAEITPTLLEGLKLTLLITALSAVVAAALGLLFAILRRSKNRMVAGPVGLFVEFIRGTPLLVQLYFIFYVLPDVGILLPPLVAGVIGMGLHYATYTAEVYRAGIENVPKGQWEAARATNLTASQTWTHVIIPQAVPPMIPALANYLIAMFKERVVDLVAASDFGRNRDPCGDQHERNGVIPARMLPQQQGGPHRGKDGREVAEKGRHGGAHGLHTQPPAAIGQDGRADGDEDHRAPGLPA